MAQFIQDSFSSLLSLCFGAAAAAARGSFEVGFIEKHGKQDQVAEIHERPAGDVVHVGRAVDVV